MLAGGLGFRVFVQYLGSRLHQPIISKMLQTSIW